MNAYTPGPWSVDFSNGSYVIEAPSVIEPGKTYLVAELVSLQDTQLIAAAPDLLTALKAIVFQVRQGKVFERDSCITEAVDAIDKATGGAV